MESAAEFARQAAAAPATRTPPDRDTFDARFVATGFWARPRLSRTTTTDTARGAPADTRQPRWPVESELHEVRRVLAGAAPLVSAADCRRLRAVLARPSFLLHAGDCAETFQDNTSSSVRRRVSLLRTMSDRIERRSGRPVVPVGRIAGQYAKPRSAAVEQRGEHALPSYFGDAVNGATFAPRDRIPDPRNLIRAYRESARTVGWLAGSGVFTSHEALLLDYEQPLTRYRPDDGSWYDLSANLLWIGERTRSLAGPHVALAAAIGNPIAVKIGPRCTPEELLALHEVLNPHNTPGRLTFIFRLGHRQARDRARILLTALAANGVADRVVSDPMHGNTITTKAGVKTRSRTEIEAELRAFFTACRETGTRPGGVHLEVSGDPVTECVTAEPDDDYLATDYRSSCDPRLNPEQALAVADLVAELVVDTRLPTAPELDLASA